MGGPGDCHPTGETMQKRMRFFIGVTEPLHTLSPALTEQQPPPLKPEQDFSLH